MKALFIMVLSLALTGCLSNENTYKQADDSEITEYENQLRSGKSVVMGDVYIDETFCGISTTYIAREGGEEVYSINKQDKINRSISIFSKEDKVVVSPGNYRVVGLRCYKSYVSLEDGKKSLSKEINDLKALLQPRFNVKSGQILHIGTLRIKTVKKSTFLNDARVLVVREPTSEQAKAAARDAFGRLSNQLVFTE
ncbi:hypothetical protein [Roseibium sediminis]|uniref:hypothetical protein n=1 Tax=Roseibium sediminis TaxID=1775174 RepID=UPI00123E38E3|nr:hypothetical protein [Roseibium sediminis]